MMKTMIPPQVGMRFRTLQKEKKEKKREMPNIKKRPNKKREKKKKEKNKMREKERRDNATISFFTLVLQNSTMIFMI